MNGDLSNLAVETLGNVEPQIYPENNLYSEHQHEPIRESGVNVLRKGSTLVQVS